MIPAVFSAVDDASAQVSPKLSAFRDASVELINQRALQQRVDRKYLMPTCLLDAFLAPLCTEYQVLRSGGQLAACYFNQYFDTPDRRFYEDHLRGRRPRYKVRTRHYHLDRDLSFLEIKCKASDKRTIKSRMERPFGESALDAAAIPFIKARCPFDAGLLIPRVWIAFRRITLVGERINERVTLDWDVEIFDDRRKERWPPVVFAEIKQARFFNGTPAVQLLRKLRVPERPFSKYCLATAKLAAVRSNIFHPDLRIVEQTSV